MRGKWHSRRYVPILQHELRTKRCGLQRISDGAGRLHMSRCRLGSAVQRTAVPAERGSASDQLRGCAIAASGRAALRARSALRAALVLEALTASVSAQEPKAGPRAPSPDRNSERGVGASISGNLWTVPQQQADWRAVQGGALLFGVSYGICVGGAASEGFHRGTAWLVAPVAGPWVALATGADANSWGLVLAGTTQLIGAGISTWGLCCAPRALGPARAVGPSRATQSKNRRRFPAAIAGFLVANRAEVRVVSSF